MSVTVSVRGWLGAALLAVGLPLTALPAPSASAAASANLCVDVDAGSSSGLTLDDWKPGVDGARMCEAVFRTDALFTPRGPGEPTIDPLRKPVNVRFYLPADYDPGAEYEVLYLLNGGAEDYLQWSEAVADAVASDNEGDDEGFEGIVVMPEGGKAGFYNDWHGYTQGNFAPLWQTFHMEQLVPWVDDHLATSGDESDRAIAGLSMGGFGALKYAVQYPELFSAVGSFSGGTDIRREDQKNIIYQASIAYGARYHVRGLWGEALEYDDYLLPGMPGVEERVESIFGPSGGPGAPNWASFNPAQVAETSPEVYRTYDGKVALYAGGADPADPTQPGPGEADNWEWNRDLHLAMDGGQIGHRYCTGDGTHSMQYWREDLKNFIDYVYGDAADVCPNGWPAPRS